MKTKSPPRFAGTIIALLILATGIARAQSSFSFGAAHVYNDSISLDGFKACGFNSIGVTLTGAVGSRNLQTLAAEDLEVVAGLPSLDHIHEAAAKAELIHWQAEDEGSIRTWVPSISQSALNTTVTHVKGGVSGDAWTVDAPETSGLAWELTDHVQVKFNTQYTALFYLRVDSIPAGEIAQLGVFDVNDPTVSFTRTVTGADFPDTTSFHPIALSYTHSDPSLSLWRSAFKIDWYGTCGLSMDSLVIFNRLGTDLARDSGTDIRNNIIAQVQTYMSDTLETGAPALRWWYGPENLWARDSVNWSLLGNLEVARYLDFLTDSLSPGTGFTWEGTRDATFWLEHDSLFFDLNPSHFRFFSYPFGVHSLPPDQDSVAALNELIDELTETLQSYRSVTEAKAIPLYYTAQAFATDHWYEGDIPYADTSRPTAAEIKCFGFLGLCYGVDGLWYWPYDQGYNDPPNQTVIRFSGLIRHDGSPTFKYDAVHDAVGPFVSRFGDLIVSLNRGAAGLLDTLAGGYGNFVTAFESTEDTPYVEAGFFVSPGSAADYLVLVNRRTDTASTQTLSLTIDPSLLQSSGSTMYYLIDKNPTYAGSSEDTTLAGPIGGSMVYSTTIEPGGAKFIKIVGEPNRITGTGFPLKWWGKIEADETVTLPAGRSMRLAPPLEFSIHTDCGPGESAVRFTVYGQLTAAGNADTPLVFKHVYDGPPPMIHCESTDSLHWSGFDFASSSACTLQYCNIENALTAVKNTAGGPLVLDHVTTVGTRDYACDLTPVSGEILLSNCVFDGTVKTTRGRLTIEDCTIDTAAIAIEAAGSGQAGDSLIVERTDIITTDTIGILIDNYPARLHICSLWNSPVGVYATNAPVRSDTVRIYGSQTGLLVDTNAILSGSRLHVVSSGIGLHLRQGWGSLPGGTFSGLDTAIISDPGTGNTVQLSHVNVFGCKKGIAARSGTLRLDTCTVFADSLSGIDASQGSAIVRITSGGAKGSAVTSAGVSIGPSARLVARNALFDDSYIGLELKGEGADTVIGCGLENNALYGIWFDNGDSTDYSSGNTVGNDTASALNVGIHVLQQSVVSVGDTVYGGYNWAFNFNTWETTGKSLRVSDALVIGKRGDDWGLVLNGWGAYDSASVLDSRVDSFFTGAHLYIKNIRATVHGSHFVSDGSLSASAYGIQDIGSNTGFVGCTEVRGQYYGCVKRFNTGSALYWTDMGAPSPDAGLNSFIPAIWTTSKTFINSGTDSVDARNNWWGDTIPDASRISGKVKYNPWLDSAECGGSQGGSSKLANLAASLPESFSLEQNYPNPFNASTTIRFALPIEQQVRLDLFNVLGQQVRSFDLGLTPAGYGSVFWNGRNESGRPVGSGIYFYRLWTQRYAETRKMLLLK